MGARTGGPPRKSCGRLAATEVGLDDIDDSRGEVEAARLGPTADGAGLAVGVLSAAILGACSGSMAPGVPGGAVLRLAQTPAEAPTTTEKTDQALRISLVPGARGQNSGSFNYTTNSTARGA